MSGTTSRKIAAGWLVRAATLVAALATVGGASAQGQVVGKDGLPIPSLRLRALAHTASLKSVLLEYPPNWAQFVADDAALQRLGKALFWDQQVGSDGQSCASCHYHAGADNRSKNQLNPGFRNQSAPFPKGDRAFGNGPLAAPAPKDFGPNRQLAQSDFPLHRLANPADARSKVLSDTNDVVSSQGVFAADFLGLTSGGESGRSSLGGTFDVGGALVRNVEPRNTPSVVNSAFNRRNFWDARARFDFNGVNPIGDLDPSNDQTTWLVNVAAASPLVRVSIPRSSTASQAVGPALSDLEMSYGGKRFAELGRKLLGATPLASQRVAADDSLLGSLSAQRFGPGVDGLTTRYSELVRQAFMPAWWNAAGLRVDIASNGTPTLVQVLDVGPNRFTVMEYNFSLFFGLAVDAYERTLRADDSPFDRFMEGNEAALGASERAGLEWFIGKGRCITCHSGPELTAASLSATDAGKGRTADVLDPPNLERMVMGDKGVAAYDGGHYNIGVRPTMEDLGIGANIGPSNLPLSEIRLNQLCVRSEVDKLVASGSGVAAPDAIRQANVVCGVPHIRARPLEAARLLRTAWELGELAGQPLGAAATLLAEAEGLLALPAFDLGLVNPVNQRLGALMLVQVRDLLAAAGPTADAAKLIIGATSLMPDPVDPGPDPTKPFGPPLGPEERVAVNGAFKVPGLRNVELTAPYFHNGGQATLEQVVEFYDRGGDFHDENVADADTDVAPIGFTPGEEAELISFLRALTDERVRYERAPFDHPSLSFPNGGTPGQLSLLDLGVPLLDDRVDLPAVGSAGSAIRLGTAGTPYANFPDSLTPPPADSGYGQGAGPGASGGVPPPVPPTVSGPPLASAPGIVSGGAIAQTRGGCGTAPGGGAASLFLASLALLRRPRRSNHSNPVAK